MSKNPIVPFLLIFSLGIGLIFFMSLHGISQKEEIAKGDSEEEVVVADFDAEGFAQAKCIACHGANLEGVGANPGLVGTDLSKEDLVDIIKNGRNNMPGNLITTGDKDIEAMADYILSLK